MQVFAEKLPPNTSVDRVDSAIGNGTLTADTQPMSNTRDSQEKRSFRDTQLQISTGLVASAQADKVDWSKWEDSIRRQFLQVHESARDCSTPAASLRTSFKELESRYLTRISNVYAAARKELLTGSDLLLSETVSIAKVLEAISNHETHMTWSRLRPKDKSWTSPLTWDLCMTSLMQFKQKCSKLDLAMERANENFVRKLLTSGKLESISSGSKKPVSPRSTRRGPSAQHEAELCKVRRLARLARLKEAGLFEDEDLFDDDTESQDGAIDGQPTTCSL